MKKEDRHRKDRQNNNKKLVAQFIYGWCTRSSIDSAVYLWLMCREFYRQCSLLMVDVQWVLYTAQFIYGWCAGSSIDSAVYLWLMCREFYRQRSLSMVDVQWVL